MNRIVLPENFDIAALIVQAYSLSIPIGMGRLDFIPGNIPTETLGKLVHIAAVQKERLTSNDAKYLPHTTECLLSMDYVHGRCCKFNIYYDMDTKETFIADRWPDHSVQTFETLLKRVGLAIPDTVTS